MRNKAIDALDNVELQIDTLMDKKETSFSMYKYLRQLDYSSRVVQYMKGFTHETAYEIKNEEGCEQLEEAYNFLTARQKKYILTKLESWESDIEKYIDEYKVLVAPGPLEIPMTKDINAVTVLNEQKALNISELASLIKDSSFVISNDTGPAHIAAHIGAKGLALFGKHTTAHKVSIERENFKAIQVSDLSKLSANKVFENILLYLD